MDNVCEPHGSAYSLFTCSAPSRSVAGVYAGILATSAYKPCPPLAIGVEGRAEAAEFWFNQWDESSAAKWNLCLPEGIEILRYREVDGPALAKLTTAGIYTIKGLGIELGADALKILEEEVTRSGVLYSSSIDLGVVRITIGDLEHCSAGCLVRALKENDICSGWAELRLVRESIGTWEHSSGTVLPLI